MSEIDYISGRKRQDVYGIAKYNREISKRQPQFRFNIIEYTLSTSNPNLDGLVKRIWYPLLIHHFSKPGNVKHIVSQDLAFILNFISIKPTIITCFDIIPWTFYKNRSLYWWLNIRGLKQADKIVAISYYTKNELISHLNIAPEKIEVVHCGVDHDTFRKINVENLNPEKFRLPPSTKIILYLGSEERRKNFLSLLYAMKALIRDNPSIHLLKAGGAFPGSRAETLKQVIKLGLQHNVTFLDNITEDELPYIYNFADVFVFPSLSEGFGLPPLEAMACGTPVISSSSSSLPEVTGDAAILVDPMNLDQLKDAMQKILFNEELQDTLSLKGQERAKLFRWDYSAEKMSKIYNEMGD